VQFPTGTRDFSLPHIVHTVSGAHPAGGASPGVKQLGHEADYSRPPLIVHCVNCLDEARYSNRIQITVFWNMMACSLVGRYQLFR
jgi:hypothetical protein